MTTPARKKILVMIDWFLPGFNGGGPITSIANLARALGGEFDFDIVTSNRDYGVKEPYPNIETDTWIDWADHCRVWYCAKDTESYRHFRKLIQDEEYDLLYLNSMFSLRYTIFPLWNSRSLKPETPVLLAPRGMLHTGALSLKPFKKKVFLRMLKLTGVYKQLRFQATDAQEAIDIKAVFGEHAQILSAPNMPKMDQPPFQAIEKEAGKLKMVFMSRLTAKKGLHLLLEMLVGQKAEIHLSIIGPDKEPGYWQQCQKIIARLPSNVTVEKHEPMPADQAFKHLQEAHCFAMPTLGENFGHAIFEAFCAGRPVLISDQTPWRDLTNRHLGFDISLSEAQQFNAAISQLAAMEQGEWDKWAKSSWEFASNFVAQGDLITENKALFEAALLPINEREQ